MFTASIADRIAEAAGELMAPPPGMDFDFSEPRGEPALVGPRSISWRIFKNPVSLFVGGVAAVVLELAEPSVRTGVWDHSSFRKDAVMRLRRTGTAAMMTVYGPRREAERMIGRVVRMHERVAGTTPDGTPYHANDQRLLDWVQATASFGFVEAYSRYVSPLSREERSKVFSEGAAAARLYGALGAPTSVREWRRLLAQTEPQLERSDIVFDFLDIMRSAPIGPWFARPVQRLFVRAAVDLVPELLREKLGLERHGLLPGQRTAVSLLAKAADRIPLKDAPPSQASVRMGLSPDFLYR
jgi:uncharacterized protein (DUF2236 family)